MMNEIIWAVVEAYRLDSNAFKKGLLVPAIVCEEPSYKTGSVEK